MNRKKILVTGGAGFIGSHVNKMLMQGGYDTLILDNLSRGKKEACLNAKFIEGSIHDQKLLDKLFSEEQIEAVMHFAAFIDVGESIEQPEKYYQNNFLGTLSLLEAMRKHNVKYFIFSSTAAIFGLPEKMTIDELHKKEPINPYGRSKLMIEQVLSDFDRAYSLKSCCLRYFNAAGGDPEGQIKYHEKKESNLIPKILNSLKNKKNEIQIYGTDYDTKDGTCVRDYIHLSDLASAHILSMENLFKTNNSSCYNLGNGLGFTVREVIKAVETVTGFKIKVLEEKRRQGDPPFLVANSEKAKKELNWRPQFASLEAIISDAWRAFL